MVHRTLGVLLACSILLVSGCLQMAASPEVALQSLDDYALNEDDSSRPIILGGINVWGFENALTSEDREQIREILSEVSDQERRILTALLGGTPRNEELYTLHALASAGSEELRVDLLDEDGPFNLYTEGDQGDPSDFEYDLRDWERNGASFARIYEVASVVLGWPGETEAGISFYGVVPQYMFDFLAEDPEEGFVALLVRLEYDIDEDCLEGALVAIDAMTAELLESDPFRACDVLEEFREELKDADGERFVRIMSEQYELSADPITGDDMVRVDLSEAVAGEDVLFQTQESILLPVELQSSLTITTPSGEERTIGLTDLESLPAEQGTYEIRLSSLDPETVQIFVSYVVEEEPSSPVGAESCGWILLPGLPCNALGMEGTFTTPFSVLL